MSQHSLSRRAQSATLAPSHLPRMPLGGGQAEEWDSNPRWLAPRRFSRPLPSAARSSLRAERFYHENQAQGSPPGGGRLRFEAAGLRYNTGHEVSYLDGRLPDERGRLATPGVGP